MPAKQNDSSKYQKLSDIEHVLHAPDTYIGSIEPDSIYGWTFHKNMITYKQYNHISGLYKIFDEALVNARDHCIRMKQKKESGEEESYFKYISSHPMLEQRIDYVETIIANNKDNSTKKPMLKKHFEILKND